MIEVHELRKKLNVRGKAVEFLAGVSFCLDHGHILGLLGSNGAGKTSTLRCLAGWLTPDLGSITFREKCGRIAKKINIRTVFEDSLHVYPRLTVHENLLYMGLVSRNRDQDSASLDVLSRLGLIDKLDKEARSLSSGQKKKLALAAALIAKPDLLLLDEPSNLLDAESLDSLVHLLSHATAHGGMSVVVSSHDFRFIEQLCDRAVILDRGRSIKETSIEDLTSLNDEKHCVSIDYLHHENILRENQYFSSSVLAYQYLKAFEEKHSKIIGVSLKEMSSQDSLDLYLSRLREQVSHVS